MMRRNNNLPLLIDSQKAAKRLGISIRKLWELKVRGDIPFVKIGRRVLYDPQDLCEWIQRNKVKGYHV